MYTNIFVSLMIITAFVGYDIAHTPEVMAQEPAKIVVATPTPVSEPSDIQGYIHYKFGEHASDALKVLECENKTLNPYADNDNRTWGGIGIDRGYWQINSVYHPYVSESCARDVKCSTDYAYRMWKNDGESFRRWTCGREYGL